jgi:hypothetical protein
MDNTLFGVIIAIMSIAIAYLAIHQRPFDSFVDFFIAGIGLSLVVFAIYQIYIENKKNKSKEHFGNTSESNIIMSSLNAIAGSINNLGAQKVMEMVDNTVNENLSPFSQGLTLYYSAFSERSYPRLNNQWVNISPFFKKPPASCPDIHYDDTHMTFAQATSFSKSEGFNLGENAITGPKSHQLGITANDSFTIFFTIKLDLPVHPQPSTTPKTYNEILKLYGNTESNNGLALYIETSSEPSIVSKLFVRFGDMQPVETTLFSNFSTESTYLIFITKKNASIMVTAHPNMQNTTQSDTITLATLQVPSGADVLLSNKEIMLNRTKNLKGRIFNFGIINRAVPDYMRSDIVTNVRVEMQKSNMQMVELQQRIDALQAQLVAGRVCPYGQETCEKCKASITDWGNMTQIMNAPKSCLDSINKYCQNHPNNDECVCWNPSNTISTTDSCLNYVSIFQGRKPITADTIDSATLGLIKIKYNLCACGATPPVEVKAKVRPSSIVNMPTFLDDIYTVNMRDIDIYNNIGSGRAINSTGTGTF